MKTKTKTTNEDVAAEGALSEAFRGGFGRRRFLVGAGGVAGLAIVAGACGSDDEARTGGTTSDTEADGTNAASTSPEGDAAIAKFAAGLEVLAVDTYAQALEAATRGALGAVPPAVAEFVTTAMAHHEAHLEAWNAVITDGGGAPVTEPDPGLSPTVADRFGKVKDVVGAARLALDLEEIAAATYLSVTGAIQSPEGIKLAGSIQSIDAKHAAILHYALGEYPVPEVFAKTDKAAQPA